MTESINISRSFTKEAVPQGSWQLYLVLGLLVNAAIWGAALLYLKNKQPTYTSTLAVTLPGAGADVNVSVPNIGQASYENSSPYASSTQDPRANYQFIAQSEPVLLAAAAQLKMPPEKFGKPEIALLDTTTIMEFEFKGESPEEARNKGFALYKALQTQLNQLRAQEVTQRDVGFQSALSSAQRKLEIAQDRLSAYKARSGLSSNEQLRDLSVNIEQLRKQRAEILAEQQQASARLGQLSASLKLSAQQAADAFALQTDQVFQQNLKDYSEASGTVIVLEAKFSPEHPMLVAEKAKQNAAQEALLTRSQSLLGRPVSQAVLKQLNLSSTNSDSARENLFQELVAVQAEQRSFQAQAQEIDRQILKLEGRLKSLAQQESTLDALKRDVQVAEAVFSSTVTRLDIGRSNAFGSYPLIQMVAEPSLSKTPSSPKKQYVLLGAALGSLFLTSAVVTLGLRKRKIWIHKQERKLEG
jgi:uncharacterized protein involved in exopolysaccharide biosynthesis